ncbi:MAG: carbonic anhydrase [Syntrophobacteraceae bacterium]
MRTRVFILSTAIAMILMAGMSAFASEAGPGMTANEALAKLMEGNQRYAANQLTINNSGDPKVRQALVAGQKPFAVILTCSDSRVPPEIIFDRTLGEIFVVRVAGNVADPVVLGSIEYAAEHLGCPLVMVLGHQKCGAVSAAFDATGEPHGNIGAIIETIAPAVKKAGKPAKPSDKAALVETAIDNNIKLVSQSLTEKSDVIKSLVKEKKLRIVGAKYSLDSGRVIIYAD